MSYSQLIQKDNPAGFWSLDETSSTTAYGHGFIVDASGSKIYNGIYSSTVNGSDFKSVLPIVYGGKSSILSTGGTLGIPSLNKMTQADCGNSSSIEFWIKVPATSSPYETVIMSKISGVQISLLNDNIVFSIGKVLGNSQTTKYSVSVPFDTINKPIHIVASYSPKEISLIVNGIQKTKTIGNYKTIFSSDTGNFIFGRYSVNDLEQTISTNVSNIQYDSISLYSYVLTRNQALRHFVYGCGYNIPTEFVDANNGVYYNFSMDGHQDIKKYEFGATNPWSLTKSNNCVVYNNVLTIKPKNEPETLFRDGYGTADDIASRFFSGSQYKFNTDSYLNISDIGSILPLIDSGWVFKFTKVGSSISSNETLFIFRSKDTDNYIEFTLTSTGIKAFINDSINSTLVGPNTFSGLDASFYIGFYVIDTNTINLIYIPDTGLPIVTTVSLQNSLSFGQTDLRIGSSDIWYDNENYETLNNVNTYTSTQALTKIIAIHKENSELYKTRSNLEGLSFNHYYTATPDYYEKRFKIRSYATAKINIPLQSLASPNKTYVGACRLELGNPYLSGNLSVSVSGETSSTINGITTKTIFKQPSIINDRIITNADWLNKYNISSIQDGEDRVDLLSFDLTFKTDDLIDQPSNLNYFRLFSYPVVEDGLNRYLTCNSSPGGNPAKIYYRNNEYAVPDLQEYPFFYNGNKNGIKIKDSYVKITQDYGFPSKFNNIVSASVNGSYLNYVLEKNNFNHGDKVIVSGVYNDNGSISSHWNFSTQVPVYLPSALSNRWNRISTTTWSTGVNYSINTRAYYGGTAGTKGIWKKVFSGSDINIPPPSSEFWELQYAGTSTTWSEDLKYNNLNIVKYSVDNFYYVCENIKAQGDNTIVLPKISGETFINYPTNNEYYGFMKTPSGIQTISFMCYIPSTTTSTNIMKVGTSQLSLYSTTLSLSGSTLYVNGVAGSTIKTNAWNHITFVFNTPVLVEDNSSVDIIIGDEASTIQEFYIDQLMIFDKKFKDSTVNNLYSLFSGDVYNKVYSTGPTLIDTDYDKTITNNTQLCYILSESSTFDGGSTIYDLLKNATSTTTLSLLYKNSSKAGDVLTTLESKFNSGSTQMFVSSSDQLKVGSTLKINGENSIYTISSIVNSDVSITPSAGASATTSSKATLTFSTDSYLDLLNLGNICYSDTDETFGKNTVIQGIDIPNKKVTISCPKGPVIKKTFTGNPIKFKNTKHKITFNSAVTLSSSIDKNAQVVFNNYVKVDNDNENNKLLIDNQYIKDEDYILIYPASGTKRLFKVTGTVDTDLYTEDITVNVSFVPQSFVNNTIYIDDEDLNISVKNTKAYLYTSPSTWTNVYSRLEDRVQYFAVPVEKV